MAFTLAGVASMVMWLTVHAAVVPAAGCTGPEPVEQTAKVTAPTLPKTVTDQMARIDWAKQVGFEAGIFVSIPEQTLYLVENGVLVWQAPCSTAAAGVGSREGSLQTPTGWHRVDTKIGDGLPWGQIFRSREATKHTWKPGMETKEDLVLTRVLILDGLEPGVNRGKDGSGKVVDSQARGIYIHGTNGEENIGKPASHGCIRLLNDDVIALFDRIPKGILVYISDK
jgi:hypothetical protein